MYQITLPSGKVFNIAKNSDGKLSFGDQNPDLIRVADGVWHSILHGESYNISLLKVDSDNQRISLKINGKVVDLEIKTDQQLLLEKMGLSGMNVKKLSEIKAPMPGLVVRIEVNIGDEVRTGTPLLVLEAMKMENILKSPGDAIVKEIRVNQGDAVEKNQVLISFQS